jgi:hypothetical protein
MKKYIVTTLILTSFVGILFITSKVEATVGGETIIYNFKYNPVDESVYYNFQSYGGRGCPPELKKLSLNSEKVETAFSCSQGEKLLSASNNYEYSPVSLEIEKITKYFKPLTPLDLKANNITIDVNFLKDENYSFDSSQIMMKHFIASIYQGNKKVKDINITGCSLEQPFTFQGYAIPGYDKRMALLLSTKGDCWEGGYTYETLYTVAGVDNLNKSVKTNFYKSSSALLPNEGNLVVYESSKKSSTNISVGQFINLLIAIGVITPDKASAAKAVFGL